ncbi:hypothetical protein AB1N83_013224 [Pleurotus pulmonarius]
MSVPEYLPFTPPNGVRYEKGDEKQLCTKTPIPLWEIDYRLLGGSQVPRLLPPMFHLGWPVGRDKLLELVQREFPELVLYTEADQKGEVLWDSIVYIPDGIIRDFNIPEELHECVQVSEVLHPDGTRQAALCVGDSRIGILRPNPGVIGQIAQRFFDGKDPQWYLDPWQWQWTRKVRILSPEEARKWAADMNAREAALAGVAGGDGIDVYQPTCEKGRRDLSHSCLNPSPPSPESAEVRFPTIAAFYDSLLDLLLEPPLKFVHFKSYQLLRTFVAYLTTYNVSDEGITKTHAPPGEFGLIPSCLQVLDEVKDENKPHLARLFLEMPVDRELVSLERLLIRQARLKDTGAVYTIPPLPYDPYKRSKGEISPTPTPKLLQQLRESRVHDKPFYDSVAKFSALPVRVRPINEILRRLAVRGFARGFTGKATSPSVSALVRVTKGSDEARLVRRTPGFHDSTSCL